MGSPTGQHHVRARLQRVEASQSKAGKLAATSSAVKQIGSNAMRHEMRSARHPGRGRWKQRRFLSLASPALWERGSHCMPVVSPPQWVRGESTIEKTTPRGQFINQSVRPCWPGSSTGVSGKVRNNEWKEGRQQGRATHAAAPDQAQGRAGWRGFFWGVGMPRSLVAASPNCARSGP